MAYYTVALKKFQDKRIERLAGGTVTPGHLVKLNSSDTIEVHSTAQRTALPHMFAIEDELQGNGIDDNYSSGQALQAEIFDRGDEVYAILATSQTIVEGDYLESAGDGTLQKMTLSSADDPQCPVAVALEAKTTTGATARIRAMVV